MRMGLFPVTASTPLPPQPQITVFLITALEGNIKVNGLDLDLSAFIFLHRKTNRLSYICSAAAGGVKSFVLKHLSSC